MRRKFAAAALALVLVLSACEGKTSGTSIVSANTETLPPVIQTDRSETEVSGTSILVPDTETPKTEPVAQEERVTLYNCGPLQIALPNEYIPQLVVETNPKGGNGYQPLINVYEKASLDAAEADFGDSAGFGFLFGFGAVEAEGLQNFLDMDIPGRTLFAQDNSRYYVYTVPTDVQFYRSGGGSETDQERWEALYELGPRIRDDIVERCELSPYSGQTTVQLPSSPDTDSSGRRECAFCGSLGICISCFDGRCTYCNGSGRDLCTRCTLGRCNACGGDGFHYQYVVGGPPAEVPCSNCNGGTCLTCGGSGYTACRYCFNGSCLTCGGTGKCPVCGGASIFW